MKLFSGIKDFLGKIGSFFDKIKTTTGFKIFDTLFLQPFVKMPLAVVSAVSLYATHYAFDYLNNILNHIVPKDSLIRKVTGHLNSFSETCHGLAQGIFESYLKEQPAKKDVWTEVSAAVKKSSEVESAKIKENSAKIENPKPSNSQAATHLNKMPSPTTGATGASKLNINTNSVKLP